jgi:hypothetical protein
MRQRETPVCAKCGAPMTALGSCEHNDIPASEKPCCRDVPGHYDDCPNRRPAPHPVPPHTPGFSGVPSRTLTVTRPLPDTGGADALLP